MLTHTLQKKFKPSLRKTDLTLRKCGYRQTCSIVVFLKVHRSTSKYLKEVSQRSTSKYLKEVSKRSTSKKYLKEVPQRSTSENCRQTCSFVVSPAGRRLSQSLASSKTGSQEKLSWEVCWWGRFASYDSEIQKLWVLYMSFPKKHHRFFCMLKGIL